ncbi:MAG: ribonuclease HIII [Candidatus Aminicenantes bacterium]
MRQSSLFKSEQGHIGTDESGKGDYFGPLVTAGIFLPEGQEKVLTELGVKDSKRVSDNRARELSKQIRDGYIHSIVAIGPERYNELYLKLRNLNRILAWAHSRVIENILEEVPCTLAVTDQFGDQRFVINALMKKGRNIELEQRTKAEEDMAVAAASILARSEFLRRLYYLGKDFKVELPKGSSPRSEETGVELVKLYGVDVLNKVAKRHFKLTKRILEAAKG